MCTQRNSHQIQRLFLSLSLSLSLSLAYRGTLTLITHLGFTAPGMHTRMFARIIGQAVRCALGLPRAKLV